MNLPLGEWPGTRRQRSRVVDIDARSRCPTGYDGPFLPVQLFVDRARAVRSDYALSDSDAPDVAEVVRQLDGLPLAIELAASRMNILGPHQLALRLAHQLEVLKSDRRDVADRHSMLRAAIDWSWDMLEGWEQIRDGAVLSLPRRLHAGGR